MPEMVKAMHAHLAPWVPQLMQLVMMHWHSSLLLQANPHPHPSPSPHPHPHPHLTRALSPHQADRIDVLCQRAIKWARLRRKENKEKKAALTAL